MSHQFSTLTFTPSVKEVQREMGSRNAGEMLNQRGPVNDSLGPDEKYFIGLRDGFYISTITETGWPYIQFRGGPAGFLHVIDEHTIAFADVTGNRQYISTGNLKANNRVALFLMDLPHPVPPKNPRRSRNHSLERRRRTTKHPHRPAKIPPRAPSPHPRQRVRLELPTAHPPALDARRAATH